MKIISAKSFFRLAIAAVFLAVIVLGVHYFWRWKAQEYRRQLQASGEKLTVAELTPAPVSAEQNGAASFQQAAAALTSPGAVLKANPPSAKRMVGPGKAMVGWAQPDLRDETDRVTNSWKDLEEDLGREAEALQILRQLTNYSALDFGVNYDLASDKLGDQLVPEKLAAQSLAADAELALHKGDTEAAASDLRAILTIVKDTQDERIVISQLVRIALTEIALNSTWEFLQSPRLTEDQLAAVQNVWSQLEFRQAAENALMMERAMDEVMLHEIRSSSEAFRKTFGQSENTDWLGRANLKSKQIAWRLWWSHPDELRTLKGFQVLLDGARFVQTNYAFRSKVFQQRTDLAELGINSLTNEEWWAIGLANPTLRSFFSQGVSTLAGYLSAIEKVETCRQMVITALALKRYQLKRGKYAPELAALVPEFLPAVPRDPIDGKPLRYQLVGSTYLLYSIGEDGVDNGGDPVPASSSANVSNWMQGRDTVWPLPATEQEIQAYQNTLSFKGQSKPIHK